MHDRQGNLWVATLGEGLWRVRDAGAASPVIERTGLRTGLSSDAVQSVLEDRDGNIWAGTTGGLHRFTQRKLTPIEDVGFVVAVESTGDRGMWAGTTNGLLRFSHRLRSVGAPGIRAGRPDPVSRRARHALDWNQREPVAIDRRSADSSSPPRPVPAGVDHDDYVVVAGAGVWLGYNDWIFRWDGTTLAPFEAPTGTSIKRITLARARSTAAVSGWRSMRGRSASSTNRARSTNWA